MKSRLEALNISSFQKEYEKYVNEFQTLLQETKQLQTVALLERDHSDKMLIQRFFTLTKFLEIVRKFICSIIILSI